MKKYRVNVNGTVYEVELEEITGATAPIAAPAVAPAPAAPVSSAPAGPTSRAAPSSTAASRFAVPFIANRPFHTGLCFIPMRR